MKWLITGDCHGNFSRFDNYPEEWNNENYALIILGDAGFNYYGDSRDRRNKQHIDKHYHFYIYSVKGNHEMRPSDVKDMICEYDENVNGDVWYEKDFPRIRYFCEYGKYNIAGYRTYVLGGAYSIDKNYRLMGHGKWFENEQLNVSEMYTATQEMLNSDKSWDLVLSHTCPYSWEPRDLFLSFIDQDQVDNSMEKWFEEIKDNINFDMWLFGHFHDDRLVRPGVEMYYHTTDYLDTIAERWRFYQETGALADRDKLIPKDPNFYMGR